MAVLSALGDVRGTHRGLGQFVGEGVGHHIFTLVTIQHRGLGQFMGEGSRSPQLYPCHHLAQRAGSLHGGRKQVTTILPLSPLITEGWASSWGTGVGHYSCTLVTIQHRGVGQFMGKRSRSPHFLLGNHLAQRAGPVNGEREQVTTILPLSPFNTQVWSSSWGKGVAHQNFTLVTIQHRGLGKFMGEGVGHQHFTLVTIWQRGIGQFMGEGRRSPHFYPCHHLAQWAGPVHGGRELVTTIVPMSPFSTQVWASSWGKGVGHHIFTLVTIQHRGLGQFVGEQSLPCHHIGQRAWSVYGRREQVTTFLNLSPLSTQGLPSFWGREVGHHIFYLVTIQHRGLGQFIVEGSRSPHF